MKKAWAAMIIVIALLFLFASCAKPDSDISSDHQDALPDDEALLPEVEPEPEPPAPELKHLRVLMSGQFSSISLSLLGNLAIRDSVFDGLLYMDPDEPEDIKGCLAQSWSHSDDWLTWTFNIKEGIRFTDGTPCDAYAISESFDLLWHDPANSPLPMNPTGINLTSWEAVSQYEFVLHLSAPCAWLETELCHGNFRALSPTAFKLWGENDLRAYVGSGPYRLTEYVEYDFDLESAWLTLEANPDYHIEERAPFIDKITLFTAMVYTYSHEEMSDALKNGTFDAIDIGKHGLKGGRKRLKVDDVLAVYTADGSVNESFNSKMTQSLWFDADRYAPFSDRNVREAMCRLIDAEKLNETFWDGKGKVEQSIWAEGTLGCVPFDGYYHDAEAGLALLAEAGLSPQDICFEVLITDVSLCDQLSAQLEEYGIRMDNAFYDESSYTFSYKGYGLCLPSLFIDYGLFSNGFGSGPHAPWMELLDTSGFFDFTVNSIEWHAKYEPEIYEEIRTLYESMVTTPHWDEMLECSRRMTQLVQESYSAIPLVSSYSHFAVRPEAKAAFDALTQRAFFKWYYT